MTSTLYVDNLIEKTSGNGVHIPGHVINYQKYTFSSYATSNSTNYVLIRSGTYTPKIVGSKVLIQTYGRMSVDPGTAISLMEGLHLLEGMRLVGLLRLTIEEQPLSLVNLHQPVQMQLL
jgi:hypothetical protein